MGRPKGSRNKNLNLNPIEVFPDRIEILIDSPKYGVLRCKIGSNDYDKVKHTRWQVTKRKDIFHVQSSSNHNEYLHRLILITDAPVIDHADGDGLNNMRHNLREASKTRNAQNRRVTPGRWTPYKGLIKETSTRKLSARIKVNGVSIHLGSFNTEIEAAMAYNEAALKYFGEFALLNKFDKVT